MTDSASRDSIPKWLTQIYLQGVLRKKYPNIQVESFTAKPPVAAGNNYASLILRVQAQCKVNGVEKEISVIVKTVHFNEESAELLSEYNAHDNEMLMYAKHLPKYQELLRAAGDDDKLTPEAIFVDNEHKAMIFEDLKNSNYKMANRKFGLDLEHMQITIRKLAKLHACSIVLQEQGEKFASFNKPLINEETTVFDPAFTLMCKELGEEITKWKGYEKYGQKFIKLSERFIKQGGDLFKLKPGQTLVLSHGDSWTANMMFKYDENNQVHDAVLIDFQICCIGSPIFDLIYFFITSACDQVKFNGDNFFKIIKMYHDYLLDALAMLKSTTKPPTLFELNQEFQERSFVKVVYALIFPVMVNENEKDADMMNFIRETETAKAFRRELFSHPKAVATMKHFLPLWDAEGLLDPLK